MRSGFRRNGAESGHLRQGESRFYGEYSPAGSCLRVSHVVVECPRERLDEVLPGFRRGRFWGDPSLSRGDFRPQMAAWRALSGHAHGQPSGLSCFRFRVRAGQAAGLLVSRGQADLAHRIFGRLHDIFRLLRRSDPALSLSRPLVGRGVCGGSKCRRHCARSHRHSVRPRSVSVKVTGKGLPRRGLRRRGSRG